MPRLTANRSFWVLSLLVATLQAQTPSPSSTAPAAEGAPVSDRAATSSTLDKSHAPRRSSQHEASAALAGISFVDPKAKKEEPPPDDDVDLREVDKPKNQIIRLPKYVVQGERPPVFTAPEINTKKGMADEAVKKYLSAVGAGLNKYRIPSLLGGLSNEEVAMAMYREDQRVKDKADTTEKVSLFRAAGAASDEMNSLQKDVDSTYRLQGNTTEDTHGRQTGNSPRILRTGDW